MVVAVGGLSALSVAAYSSVSHIDEFRSHDKVVASELLDSVYSCLEDQVHHLIRPGSEVWINPAEGDVNAGPGLSLIPNPLRIVVAESATLTPVKKGHVALFLVMKTGKSACRGLLIEKVSPPGVSQQETR